MQDFFGRVRPFEMPRKRGGRRAQAWRSARRPTVEERERSDQIVADCALGLLALALCLGVPNLASVLYMAAMPL